MRKHNGIRPHDLVILLQIALNKNEYVQMKDMANKLFISPSEISTSLQRSVYSGLVADDRHSIIRESLLKFIIYGLPYTFPTKPGTPAMGIPTGHSAYPLSNFFNDSEIYVWPYENGEIRGLSIEPYYTNQPKAVKFNNELHAVLALTDAIRLGRKREKNMASDMLEQILIYRKTTYELS